MKINYHTTSTLDTFDIKSATPADAKRYINEWLVTATSLDISSNPNNEVGIKLTINSDEKVLSFSFPEIKLIIARFPSQPGDRTIVDSLFFPKGRGSYSTGVLEPCLKDLKKILASNPKHALLIQAIRIYFVGNRYSFWFD